MTVFQAFAEFERKLIIQRVNEKLKAARARGRKGGCPHVNQKNQINYIKPNDHIIAKNIH